MDALKVVDYKGFKIEVHHDECPSDPIADWDGNVKYALFHNRYSLQNDTDLNTKDYGSWDEFKQALVKKYRALAILPVYMYDHSGQTIATTPFSCRWDSGQLGFAFINKECLKEWGYKSRIGFEKGAKQTLEDTIVQNVKLYDSYIRGEVYGYKIINRQGDEENSCWGFYGDYDEMVKECKSEVDAIIRYDRKQRLAKLKTFILNKVPLTVRAVELNPILN
jgi:hypothetical protein